MYTKMQSSLNVEPQVKFLVRSRSQVTKLQNLIQLQRQIFPNELFLLVQPVCE